MRLAVGLENRAEVVPSLSEVHVEDGTHRNRRVVGDLPATYAAFFIGSTESIRVLQIDASSVFPSTRAESGDRWGVSGTVKMPGRVESICFGRAFSLRTMDRRRRAAPPDLSSSFPRNLRQSQAGHSLIRIRGASAASASSAGASRPQSWSQDVRMCVERPALLELRLTLPAVVKAWHREPMPTWSALSRRRAAMRLARWSNRRALIVPGFRTRRIERARGSAS